VNTGDFMQMHAAQAVPLAIGKERLKQMAVAAISISHQALQLGFLQSN
jgi:hypothetical protein